MTKPFKIVKDMGDKQLSIPKAMVLQWLAMAVIGVGSSYLTIFTQQNNMMTRVKILELRQEKSEKDNVDLQVKFDKIMEGQNEIKIILNAKADKKYKE